MRILVTGSNGQVVTALKQVGSVSGADILTLGRPEADLAQPESLSGPVHNLRPDVIISAAAYTAVDQAESEPELAHRINVDGPAALAKIASDMNIPILHLSTDYVFDGLKVTPYNESDTTGPVSVYGRTKLAGERAVATVASDHVILRTAWVYSPFGNNFVKTMLRLGETREAVNVVADQFGCPSSALDIARALIAIAERKLTDKDPALNGVFHMAGQGETSWADFAAAIFAKAEKYGRRPVSVNPIATHEYPAAAVRPANSRLDTRKLAKVYGVTMPQWSSSLDECLNILLSADLTEKRDVK